MHRCVSASNESVPSIILCTDARWEFRHTFRTYSSSPPGNKTDLGKSNTLRQFYIPHRKDTVTTEQKSYCKVSVMAECEAAGDVQGGGVLCRREEEDLCVFL